MRRFIPSLSALECFDAAARHRSFTRAAEDLGLTQSGVSRQIAALEAFLGLPLFRRIGSRLVLTEAGEGYLRETHRLLGELETSAIDTVRGRSLRDALVIEAPVSFAAHWLVPRLARFTAARPDLLVEIVGAAGGAERVPERVDLAIRRGRGAWAEARADPLCPEVLTVIAPPGMPAEDLSPGPLDFGRVPTLQNAARPDLWMTWLRGSGVKHSGAIRGPRFDTSALLIAAVGAGLGLAVVPRLYVADAVKQGLVREPFAHRPATPESFWALRPESRLPHPETSRFLAWLAEELAPER
ncbi:DNA-binding transcriptional regulator, LysR family [Celeribacter indicus]|nr:DNA-binding transcriptional regulator, LysR family [Celeribacter indicus]